jgi:16S rRNA (adenine1518-N6/adenine1519-N6)-dimethyltransferase
LAETKIVLEVPQKVFIPSPSVDGALVIINSYQNTDISKEQLTSFLRFLKNCFCFRRKTLLNNLNSFAGNYREK